MLLVLKLEKTSVAVVLPLFRAASQSSSAEGGKIFFGDCRRKRPLLIKREMSCNTVILKKASLDYITRPKHKCITTIKISTLSVPKYKAPFNFAGQRRTTLTSNILIYNKL